MKIKKAATFVSFCCTVYFGCIGIAALTKQKPKEKRSTLLCGCGIWCNVPVSPDCIRGYYVQSLRDVVGLLKPVRQCGGKENDSRSLHIQPDTDCFCMRV